MVSQVDAGVGKIISSLEELGIHEDTVVIFTADHGDMQGSHGLKNKCYSYEKSCGIPFIVSVPGGRKGTVSASLVSGIDLYPTCLEYANLQSESHLQGKSFAPYSLGEEQSLDKPVFAESEYKSWKMVRHGRYKLTIDSQTKAPYLLYDMDNDPYELNNLVNCDEFNDVKEALTNMIINTLRF